MALCGGPLEAGSWRLRGKTLLEGKPVTHLRDHYTSSLVSSPQAMISPKLDSEQRLAPLGLCLTRMARPPAAAGTVLTLTMDPPWKAAAGL